MLGRLSIVCMAAAAALSLASCVDERADDVGARAAYLELSLNMPLSDAYAPGGYENGNIYENGINNYRIFFYTADTDTYICTLSGQSISAADADQHTEYTITGRITDDRGVNPLEGAGGSFKVVMIANWDWNDESPEAGSTIADLCGGAKAQYAALESSDFDLSKYRRYLPYFGVREYSGVSFEKSGTTRLSGALTLLRAVAKVEIIIDDDEDGDDSITLASATLHHYNKVGYSAPAGVTSENDYGQARDWASDYTGGRMHLVDGANDAGATGRDLELIRIQDRERDSGGRITQKEKWIAYMPEYDNSGDDFAYISLRFGHQLDDDSEYDIYFAVYDEDGTTKAYDKEANDAERAKRRSILRNNLYRYNVRVSQGSLRVFVGTWENVFDNEWTFGTMSEIMEAGATFMIDDENSEYYGTYFEVVSDDEEEGLTVKITQVPSSTSGQYNIPETIEYLGYTYTVEGIGANCFDADETVTVISIPSTVTYIEDYAFEGDTHLVSIIFHSSTPPDCEADAFDGDDTENITIYIPTGSKDQYSSHEVWGQFQSVEVDGLN